MWERWVEVSRHETALPRRRTRPRLTDDGIPVGQQPDVVYTDPPVVSVVKLHADQGRVGVVGVGRHRARVEAAVLLAPVGAHPGAHRQLGHARHFHLQDLRATGGFIVITVFTRT